MEALTKGGGKRRDFSADGTPRAPALAARYYGPNATRILVVKLRSGEIAQCPLCFRQALLMPTTMRFCSVRCRVADHRNSNG